MKKLLIAATLLATLTTKAQKQDTVLNDSTPLVSIQDFQNTLNSMSDKVSHSTFLIIQEAYQKVISETITRRKIKLPKK